MTSPDRTPLPVVAWFYLALAVLGAASTWTCNVLAIRELGRMFTPAEFVAVGFTDSPLLASVACDFWVGSLASLLWIVAEGRRLGMRHVWAYVALTLGVAWAFALPLFLFVRERRLAA